MKPSEIAQELLGGMLVMFLIGFVVMGLYVIAPAQGSMHSETIITGEK